VPGLTAICLLLVGVAMLKSAQFPFHSWLPDTMETQTPLSALMHAGIINAGGFLIVRLSPVVSLSPVALNTLAIVGAFTAIFASLVMMTQASIKRMLALSTIAQMGFMMLQCGLGAFSIAVLHIVAHSLYKAHAFFIVGQRGGDFQKFVDPARTSRRAPRDPRGFVVGGYRDYLRIGVRLWGFAAGRTGRDYSRRSFHYGVGAFAVELVGPITVAATGRCRFAFRRRSQCRVFCAPHRIQIFAGSGPAP